MNSEDEVATLADDEIETRSLGGAPQSSFDDATDTADDTGDPSDTTDTGDDAGDPSDTTDTGDDAGDSTPARGGLGA
jgi:hypothetical protein